MKVLITETLADGPASWLAEHADVCWVGHDAPEFKTELQSADALVVRTYTQVNGALLDQAPQLKVVGRAGVGLDNIDLAECQRRGIPVVYTPDANTQAVVEYVVGLILDALRPRTTMPRGLSAGQFHELRKTEVGKQLDRLTLGIVGFGRIGKRIGQVARAIGMDLLVCDLLPEGELRRAVDYPFEFADHRTVYANANIVTIHVDGRPSNRHMLNAGAWGHFRGDTLFLNTARGMLLDTAALADFLQAHPTARAIIDVHDPEPPPADYLLYELPNCRLLPHLASRTNAALENMSWVVRDVVAVLEGRAPEYPAFSR